MRIIIFAAAIIGVAAQVQAEPICLPTQQMIETLRDKTPPVIAVVGADGGITVYANKITGEAIVTYTVEDGRECYLMAGRTLFREMANR